MDKVRFNPFTLVTTITGFELSDLDGMPLVALDSFRADLQVSGLFRRALRFREIVFEHPVVSARILQDGRPSVADLMEPNHDAKVADSSSKLPRLIVDRLVVSGGVVQFTDASLQPVYDSRFEPLSLDVRNLITIPEEGGAHTITIGVEDGAVLRWTGEQTVEPLRFAGRLDVTGLNLSRLWDYIGRHEAVDVYEGRVDLVLPYEMKRGDDQHIHINLNGASAGVRSLSVRSRDENVDWFNVPELKVENVKAAWPANRLDIGSVRVARPHVLTVVGEDRTFNWSKVFRRTSVPPDKSAPQWQFRIETLDIESGSAVFEDTSTEPDVMLGLTELAVRANGISSDLAAPVPVSVKGRVLENGTIDASGTMTPSPITADIKFDASRIDVGWVRPYIESAWGSKIASGTADARGQLMVSGDKPTVKMSANVAVHDVEWQDSEGIRLATAQGMEIDALTIETPPGRARARKIVIDRPFANILIERDGHLNLTNLKSPQPSSGSRGPVASDAQPDWKVEIGSVEFRNATADFEDKSLLLPFKAEIHSANGTIRDLSSFASAPATLALEGRVDQTGSVKTAGTLRLANPMASSEVNVEFRSIEMADLTPYFAQFAGYSVRRGVLDLDVRYIVKDRRLIGNHTIVARDLQLGDRVKDSKGPGLPIRVAVALLKDKEGRININVPIEGTVDSPEWDYKKVFWAAVRTILGNAAKAPFRAIGRLFGKDEDDLELVEFDPGRSDLLPSEQDMLARAANEIGPKQDLTVAVEGRFDPVADQAALKQTKLEKLIDSRREAAATATANSGASVLETILEQLFIEQFSADALAAEKQRFPALTAQAAGTPDAAAFYESLRARLLEAQTVSDTELSDLASARATAIASTLTKTGAIEAGRVTINQPRPVNRKKSGSTRIASEMAMSAEGDHDEH